jgi:hypothetical protein
MKPSFKPERASRDPGSSGLNEWEERGSDLSGSKRQGNRDRVEPRVTVLVPTDPPLLSDSAAVVLVRILQQAAGLVGDRLAAR